MTIGTAKPSSDIRLNKCHVYCAYTITECTCNTFDMCAERFIQTSSKLIMKRKEKFRSASETQTAWVHVWDEGTSRKTTKPIYPNSIIKITHLRVCKYIKWFLAFNKPCGHWKPYSFIIKILDDHWNLWGLYQILCHKNKWHLQILSHSFVCHSNLLMSSIFHEFTSEVTLYPYIFNVSVYHTWTIQQNNNVAYKNTKNLILKPRHGKPAPKKTVYTSLFLGVLRAMDKQANDTEAEQKCSLSRQYEPG